MQSKPLKFATYLNMTILMGYSYKFSAVDPCIMGISRPIHNKLYTELGWIIKERLSVEIRGNHDPIW